MGYYDKERVRGFLHNQDGIIVNDFGEEVILRGWGMGNWDNPEGFMLGTQSGFGLFEPGKYAPMGRMDRGRSMDQILRETCGTKYAEEFWKRWRRLLTIWKTGRTWQKTGCMTRVCELIPKPRR